MDTPLELEETWEDRLDETSVDIFKITNQLQEVRVQKMVTLTRNARSFALVIIQ